MKQYQQLICLIGLTSIFVGILGGCATPGEGLLPMNEKMRTVDIYNKVINNNRKSNNYQDFYQQRANFNSSYSKQTKEEIKVLNKKFMTLPNPQIPLYVFAHRVQAGDEMLPVLGYTTVFHLYKQEQFALPGERY